MFPLPLLILPGGISVLPLKVTELEQSASILSQDAIQVTSQSKEGSVSAYSLSCPFL